MVKETEIEKASNWYFVPKTLNKPAEKAFDQTLGDQVASKDFSAHLESWHRKITMPCAKNHSWPAIHASLEDPSVRNRFFPLGFRSVTFPGRFPFPAPVVAIAGIGAFPSRTGAMVQWCVCFIPSFVYMFSWKNPSHAFDSWRWKADVYRCTLDVQFLEDW